MAVVTNPLVQAVIGNAITVHRALGPGLFESVYARCLVHELERNRIPFREQVALPLKFEGLTIACAYRVDLIIADELVVEMKSIERLLPLHDSQVLTYLKLSGARQALLIYFNVRRPVDGIKSFLPPATRLSSRADLPRSVHVLQGFC